MKYEVKKIFIDRHTSKKYKVGEVIDITKERAAEIESVDKTLIAKVATKKSKKED